MISASFSFQQEGVAISFRGTIDSQRGMLSINRYVIAKYGWTAQDYATRSDGAQAHFDYPSSTLRQINLQRTNFTRFLYRNIREIYQSSTEYNTFVLNGWLLKDATGSYVTRGTNHHVDIGNSEYQQWLADWYYNNLQPNFDALFLDNGMYATEGNWHYGASGEPINPRTSKPFTDDEVVNGYIGIYRAIKAKVGNKIMVANGIYTGTRWMRWGVKDNYIKLVNELDGFMTEGWLSRWDPDPKWNYYSETYAQDSNYNWKDSVDMLVEINNLFSGKHIIVTANNVDDQDEWAPYFASSLKTAEEKQQYCLYNYASLLLGASSKNTYWLVLGWWGLTNMQNLFNINIGTPLGNYSKDSNDIYTRAFSNGVVLVNPSNYARNGILPHTGVIQLES
jgi:hypothetical protein